MIRTALEFIKKELAAYMTERENDSAYKINDTVDLKALKDDDISATSHITLMLAGMEEERREGKRPYYIPNENKEYMRLNPPVELDLFLLFIAHSTVYETALRDLASVVSFFQANPVFTEQQYPSMNVSVSDPANKPWQLIERLSFKMYGLGFEQQNNLWAMLGAKYKPSIMYKVNMLTIFDTKGKEKVAPVTELNLDS